MFFTTASDFLAAAESLRIPACNAATARGAFLVSPDGFALSSQSARDNRYMTLDQPIDLSRARAQHAGLVRALAASVPTICFPGDPQCPDGIFPNNVFATTASRRLVIGRMHHEVRRREALREDIPAFFRDIAGYQVMDLSTSDCVAELTGALVIDRARSIGYCGLSERCDLAGAHRMQDAFGLALMFCFELAASEYHTNVVLAILAGRGAIIAADGFADPAVAEAIAAFYGDCVVRLEPAQKNAYAGNAIALDPHRVWLSQRAADALRPDQRVTLNDAGFAIGAVALDEIEKAGGSLRCCVAEIF